MDRDVRSRRVNFYATRCAFQPRAQSEVPFIAMAAIEDSLIYIADDEAANVSLLETILTRAGFHSITSVPNGAALLAEVAAKEPDLILLDLRMPVVDGLVV